MSGRKPDKWSWAPIGDAGAVRWEQDVITGEWVAAGLVLYGRIDSDRLREVRLRELPTGAARIDTRAGVVPTEAQIREAAGGGGAAGFWEVYGGGSAQVGFAGERPVMWQSRQPGESPDEFYQRTAALYRAIQRAYPKSATTHLAEMAEVPYTTAVRWVRECRSRGYLPESSLQRTRRSNREGEQQA